MGFGLTIVLFLKYCPALSVTFNFPLRLNSLTGLWSYIPVYNCTAVLVILALHRTQYCLHLALVSNIEQSQNNIPQMCSTGQVQNCQSNRRERCLAYLPPSAAVLSLFLCHYGNRWLLSLLLLLRLEPGH